jgi:hypothetical protein
LARRVFVELRREIDEQRDLVRRMEENVEDAGSVIEGWRETFEMELTADGCWTWKPFWTSMRRSRCLIESCSSPIFRSLSSARALEDDRQLQRARPPL